MEFRRRMLLVLIVLLCLAGMGVSLYDLTHDWASEDSFCDITTKFSCTVVNSSKYAKILGIPVALIGFAGYLALCFLAVHQLISHFDGFMHDLMLLAAFAAVVFSLYLTAIEAFVLNVYCPTCLASLAFIIGVFISILFLYTGLDRHLLLQKLGTPVGFALLFSGILGIVFISTLAYHFTPEPASHAGFITQSSGFEAELSEGTGGPQAEQEPVPESEPSPEPEPVAVSSGQEPKPAEPEPEPEPEPEVEPMPEPQEHMLDEFAQCLTDKGIHIYISVYCGHCASQAQMFGDSFRYVTYVDCSNQEVVNYCINQNVTGTPTWGFPDGTHLVGKRSLFELEETSGCELPSNYEE